MNTKLFHFQQYPSCNSILNQNDPTDFHFSYQKQEDQYKQQFSPAATCPGTNCSITTKQLSFPKYNQKQFESSFSNSHQIIIVNQCVEQFDQSVSKYLEKSLHLSAVDKIDFLSVSQFEQLALQNKQLSKMIEQYQQIVDSNQSVLRNIVENHQTIKWFLQEITYINKEKINFQLLVIVDEILLNYKQTHIKFLQYNTINETAEKLLHSCFINFINFRFLNTQNQVFNQQIQTEFFKFIQKLFDILDSLMFQIPSSKIQPEVEIDHPLKKTNKLNLFSSKKDLWDSQQQNQEQQLGKCLKRVKLN